MHYLSHPTPAFAQSDDTVYKFRLSGCALVLMYQCLVMTLPALKLWHVPTISDWSWAWITLPIWAPSVLLAVVLGVEQLAKLGKTKVTSQVHSLSTNPSAASY